MLPQPKKTPARGVTTLLSPQLPRRNLLRQHPWAAAFFACYIGGLAVFHRFADFEVTGWAQTYYLWQFTKDLLAVLGFCALHRILLLVFCPVLVYSAVRLLLEINAVVTGQDVNHYVTVSTLFVVALAACGLIVLLLLLYPDFVKR